MNELVFKLQASMRNLPQATGLITKHYWADGMYCRELYRPADTTIVGKVHKKEHLFIVVSGTLLITNGDEPTEEVTGPKVFVCQPGTKRATYAVTDVTAITVHRCEFRDMADIDNDLVEYDPDALFLPGNSLKALT
jgi:hypothetical protein